jgi:branched-chain amino acid transport system ATP-binding protein
MLSFEGVSLGYGASAVVQEVSATVSPGEVVAILGINGAGKTTLLHGLMGFNPLFGGAVNLDSVAIGGLAAHEISRRGLALVPQGRRIFKSLTVRENLTLAQRSGREGRWKLQAVLDLFPRLQERMHHGGSQLSGGEQQMLAWGRALLTNPSFILMDEPTEGLSPRFVRLLGELITKLKTEGIGILLAEQNIEFACDAADRLLILVNGRFTQAFSREEMDRQGIRGEQSVKMLASIVQGVA